MEYELALGTKHSSARPTGSSSNGKSRGGPQTYTTDQGIYGTATYALAWHQLKHEVNIVQRCVLLSEIANIVHIQHTHSFEPSRDLTRSRSGKQVHLRGQFFSGFAATHHRVNHLLSLIHPDFHALLHAVRGHISAHPTVRQLLAVWESLFLGHSVTMNRQSGEHLDEHGLRRGLDVLLAAGDFQDGALYLKDMNVRVRLAPGDLVAFDGTSQRHAVEPWSGAQRISNAFFVHRSVFEEVGLDTALQDITLEEIECRVEPRVCAPSKKQKRHGREEHRLRLKK